MIRRLAIAERAVGEVATFYVGIHFIIPWPRWSVFVKDQEVAVTRVAIVGAGIVGLAVGARLAEHGHAVTVIEKESTVAAHQTGRNSGVIHSGLYYTPGSLKATMSIEGNRSMHAFAVEHGVPVERCGKLVVATEESQLGRLASLTQRAEANGVRARQISAEEAREIEPYVNTVGALLVEDTGIVDYRGVSRALAGQISDSGGELRFNEAFVSANTRATGVNITTAQGAFTADVLVNCAGLQSDRIARASGQQPSARIVPFRGEYFELVVSRRHLVSGLIYPIPDPRFPFLGVHLTRMIDGSIHAGPNAVLALAREGYDWRTIRAGDVASMAAFPGLWRMGLKNLRPAIGEVARSLSRKRFAASLAALVPEISETDLVVSTAGVRAQAMFPSGAMVDDFLIQSVERQVHVLNAPSPAATCALEIARHISERVEQVALAASP